MRHRARRPFLDLWLRLPRTAARPLGALARLSPLRAAMAAAVVLGVGTTTVVTVASVYDTTSQQRVGASAPDGRAAAPTSRGTTRPPLDDETASGDSQDGGGESASDTPTPQEKSEGSKPGRPRTDLPRADGTPSLGSSPGGQIGTPGTGTSSEPGSTSSGEQTTSSAPSRDTAAPNTTVTEKLPAGDTVQLAFTADEPASFACSLDGAAFTSCASPVTYANLRPGWHTFAVRATDPAGNVDPTPAKVRWHADRSSGDSDQG